VLLILGTNKQPSEPKHTNTHSGNLHCLLHALHRSDRWPEPVRPVTTVRSVGSAGQAGSYSSRTTNVPESLSDFSRPWNKDTPKTQPARKKNPTQSLARQHLTGQELSNNNTTQRHTDQATHPRQIPQRGLHRSDRPRAPVRPVTPGQLGMNNTCRSTLPNPTLDLPIHSTDSQKTLGIVGTPWALHSQVMVHQNSLNQEESKDFHQEH
jgi:hypothetical protein